MTKIEELKKRIALKKEIIILTEEEIREMEETLAWMELEETEHV